MDLLELMRSMAALAFTVGLVLVAAVLARKYMPGAAFKLKSPSERRLRVLETLMLDPQRRLVLVSVDGRERLILIGDGRQLPEPSAQAVETSA